MTLASGSPYPVIRGGFGKPISSRYEEPAIAKLKQKAADPTGLRQLKNALLDTRPVTGRSNQQAAFPTEEPRYPDETQWGPWGAPRRSFPA